jgi:hypothetical protein
MIYTAVARIDVNANQPYDTEPTYQWVGLDILAADAFVCEVQILDEQDCAVAILDQPTAAELAFVRNVVRLSEIYATALAWRDTVQYTDSERLAESRLRKLLDWRQ